jgi:hypothetical protein
MLQIEDGFYVLALVIAADTNVDDAIDPNMTTKECTMSKRLIAI